MVVCLETIELLLLVVFASNLGIFSLWKAELFGAMLAIELAFARGWHNLWLECDSKLLVDAFKSEKGVPWKIRNRWRNCLIMTRQMNFLVSHIYREGNSRAHKFATHGLSINSFIWWDLIPSFIREDFNRNRFGLPWFRFK